jgi:hypothetical protein
MEGCGATDCGRVVQRRDALASADDDKAADWLRGALHLTIAADTGDIPD